MGSSAWTDPVGGRANIRPAPAARKGAGLRLSSAECPTRHQTSPTSSPHSRPTCRRARASASCASPRATSPTRAPAPPGQHAARRARDRRPLRRAAADRRAAARRDRRADRARRVRRREPAAPPVYVETPGQRAAPRRGGGGDGDRGAEPERRRVGDVADDHRARDAGGRFLCGRRRLRLARRRHADVGRDRGDVHRALAARAKRCRSVARRRRREPAGDRVWRARALRGDAGLGAMGIGLSNVVLVPSVAHRMSVSALARTLVDLQAAGHGVLGRVATAGKAGDGELR